MVIQNKKFFMKVQRFLLLNCYIDEGPKKEQLTISKKEHENDEQKNDIWYYFISYGS